MRSNTNKNRHPHWLITAAGICVLAAISSMSGCLAAAAGGAGYVVGHEVGENDDD